MYEKNRNTTARGTRGRIFALVLIVIMMVAGSGMLFAQSNPTTNSVSAVASFGFRRFDFSRSDTRVDVTGWGPGIELSYDRFLSQEISVGVSLAGEFYFYRGSATIKDIKAYLDLKFRLVPTVITDSNIKLYFLAGFGVDYALGGDSPALMASLRPGLQLNVQLMEGLDLVATASGAINFKGDEYKVFHGQIGIGVSYSFGEPAPGKVVTAEDRAKEKAASKLSAKEAAAKSAPEAEPTPAPVEPAPAPVEPAPAPVEPAPAPVEPAPAPVEPTPAEPETAEVPATETERPYHTEQVSYVTESVEVEKVTTYTVGDVEIEKRAVYVQDTVVTTTVVVWED